MGLILLAAIIILGLVQLTKEGNQNVVIAIIVCLTVYSIARLLKKGGNKDGR